MDIFIKVVQAVLAFSLLVLVHELGHFLFARLFRIRVDKFYLFFNPGFSLFKYKPKNSETEYGIGWLPLGGYCKIAGMIDESLDTEAMKKEPQPWEYRSRPAWQRFFVIVGGVLFNLIFAFLLYSAMLYAGGESYLKNQDAVHGIICNDLAKEIGFKDGDKILAYDQTSLLDREFHLLVMDLLHQRPQTITVLRGSDTLSFGFDQSFIPQLLKNQVIFGVGFPFIVQALSDDSPNRESGILAGDRLTALNDTPVHLLSDAQPLLRQHAGDSVIARFDRGGTTVTIPLWVDLEGRIGVWPEDRLSSYFHITQKNYSFFTAIPAGVNKAYRTIRAYIRDLGLIFSPKTEAYKSVGSVIAIGNIFPTSWDWGRFWEIVALLSIMLAVLNLLPIPVLDGGHILFILCEMITGRKPGDKFLEYAQMVGMVVLFAIFALAMGNDIIRLFK
ncbi:MAG: RIP metalloprotease RseP [Bacteroidales bacterium]|nr:RIP metalloprotease RseP [Bacteroidales bacterium]